MPVMRAFAEGAEKAGAKVKIIQPDQFSYLLNAFDAAAVFGILRGSDRVIRVCQRTGKNLFWIDHAYFCRMDPQHSGFSDNSCYRISLNHHQAIQFRRRPSDRWEKYLDRVPVLPWRPIDDSLPYLFCPAAPDWVRWHGSAIPIFEREMRSWVAPYPIRLRGRDATVPLSQDLSSCRGVVAFSSNVAVDALLAGVPVFVSKESVCHEFSRLNHLNPWRGDRSMLLNHLAYSQFSVGEIRSGEALRIILEKRA